MGDLVALVFSRHADPGGGDLPSPRPAHVVRGEIPVITDLLRDSGHTVLPLPVGEDFLETARTLALRSPDVVFNFCEDLPGDSAHEMHFTALMELLGLAYTGSPPLALGLCRDKGRTKALVRQYGIPTPDFVVASRTGFDPGSLGFPLMVKPALEDGSIDIDDGSVVGDESALRERVSLLLSRHAEVLVEEYVPGRELNAAVLMGNSPHVLPLSEIDFSGLPEGVPAICGYKAKWDEEDPRCGATVPLCPAPLDEGTREKAAVLTASVCRILGLRDYARVDWRLSPERGLQFLEANPNPDISPGSGFIRSLRADGGDYPRLVEFLLDAARSRGAGSRRQGEGALP